MNTQANTVQGRGYVARPVFADRPFADTLVARQIVALNGFRIRFVRQYPPAAPLAVGQSVIKVGWRTGLTTGRVTQTCVTVNLVLRIDGFATTLLCQEGVQSYFSRTGIEATTVYASRQGDSGAPVLSGMSEYGAYDVELEGTLTADMSDYNGYYFSGISNTIWDLSPSVGSSGFVFGAP